MKVFFGRRTSKAGVMYLLFDFWSIFVSFDDLPFWSLFSPSSEVGALETASLMKFEIVLMASNLRPPSNQNQYLIKKIASKFFLGFG